MKKIMFAFILMGAVLGTIAIVQSRDKSIIQSKNMALPTWDLFSKLNLTSIKGQPASMPELSNKKGMLILYNPECESCIIKLYELKNVADAFQKWEIVLVSSQARQEEATALIQKIGLEQQEHITTLLADERELMELYYIKSVPQVLLFDSDGNLLQILSEFEIDFESIIKKWGLPKTLNRVGEINNHNYYEKIRNESIGNFGRWWLFFRKMQIRKS